MKTMYENFMDRIQNAANSSHIAYIYADMFELPMELDMESFRRLHEAAKKRLEKVS